MGDEMRKHGLENQKEDSRQTYRVLIWIASMAVLFLLGCTMAFFYSKRVVIQNNNMKPELAEQATVWVDRMCYLLGTPKRNDVIVYENKDKEVIVSRVIGLP